LSSLTAAAISRAVADVVLFPLLRVFICCLFGLRIAKDHSLQSIGLYRDCRDTRTVTQTWQAALLYANKRNCGNRESSRGRHCARLYHFVIDVWRAKEAQSARVKHWEIIADNLSKAGWSWGCVSTVDSRGQTHLPHEL
jgi:hypothetical protein